jgi:TrmH family RNA methyltransferase
LKWYKTLATKKGRLASGAFLVEGQRAIAHIMRHHADAILEVLTVEDPPAAYKLYPLRLLTESQLRSVSRTKTPQGTLGVVRLPSGIYTDELPADIGTRILMLEDVQDPGNVGTLIRTAAAFDFLGVILTDKCADPFSPKCVQSTAGSVLSVWIRRTPRYMALVETLKQSGYSCVAADLHGVEDPSLLASPSRLILALGNEATGLSAGLTQMADRRVHIPVSTQVESLNVAACGAICMYLSSVPTALF